MKTLFNHNLVEARIVSAALLSAMAIALALGFWQPTGAGELGTALLIGMAVAPFPVTPQLTAVALAYRNNAMIADAVLPRVPVGAQTFKYNSFPKGETITVPDTKVGRKGAPNTVEFTATEVDGSTQDHALDDEVPNADIQNAAAQPGMPDPLMRATEGVTELIVLAREIRAAALVFTAANYAAANRVTLAGNDIWSTKHADSDPITDILAGLDVPMMRPNVMVLGQSASIALRTHPDLLKAFNGSSAGDTGVVPLSFIKELFELEEVVVGQGWVASSKKGQAVTRVRVWGGDCTLIYRNKQADTQRGVTFGITAQWGARVAGSEYDGKIGMRGGQRVRVGESVKELLMADDLGYLIKVASS